MCQTSLGSFEAFASFRTSFWQRTLVIFHVNGKYIIFLISKPSTVTISHLRRRVHLSTGTYLIGVGGSKLSSVVPALAVFPHCCLWFLSRKLSRISLAARLVPALPAHPLRVSHATRRGVNAAVKPTRTGTKRVL